MPALAELGLARPGLQHFSGMGLEGDPNSIHNPQRRKDPSYLSVSSASMDQLSAC